MKFLVLIPLLFGCLNSTQAQIADNCFPVWSECFTVKQKEKIPLSISIEQPFYYKVLNNNYAAVFEQETLIKAIEKHVDESFSKDLLKALDETKPITHNIDLESFKINENIDIFFINDVIAEMIKSNDVKIIELSSGVSAGVELITVYHLVQKGGSKFYFFYDYDQLLFWIVDELHD